MKKFLLNNILPLNVIFDILLPYLPYKEVLSILRGLILILLVITSILNNPNHLIYYKWIIVFAVYVLLNVVLSTNMLVSFSISLKIIISILFFVVGFNYFNETKKMFQLLKSLSIVYFVLILNIVISTFFKIGTDPYSDSTKFLAGNLSDNWNIFTYSLLLFPMLNFFSKRYNYKLKKYVLQFLALITMILLVLSIKRIAILGLIVGLFIFAFFNFKFSKIFRIITISSISLILLFPLYGDLLTSRLYARQDRFEDGALTEESRFQESIFVWEETLSFRKPIKSIFGLEGFNSVGNYAQGSFGERNLHIDYNLIVNTIGLIGLLIYFKMHIAIYKVFKNFRVAKPLLEPTYFKLLRGTFYALLLTSLITSLGGQMYAITFRLIIFIFLGAILGNLRTIIRENNLNSNIKIFS